MTATRISLRGLTKRFGTTTVVDDLTTDIAAGSFTALLGPSGCGKSTTLSMIAGLLAPDAGHICFDGNDITAVPPERRPVGLVFQKPLLFPHLNVEQNVAFGLRMRRLDRSHIRHTVRDMLERVQLADLAHRRVRELSGGQEQRVALARALVLAPSVLLLDEPFSQLDAALRAEMRALVRELHDESALTTIFVTHDQSEAVDVADSIALLLGGHLAGHHEPAEFFTRPPSLDAARFFGVTNELHGTITSGTFTSQHHAIRQPTSLPAGPATLVVRPEALRLHPCEAPDTTVGVAVAARFAGTHLIIEVDTADGPLRVHQPIDAPVALGATVHVSVPVDACTIFATPPDQTASINHDPRPD